MGDKKFNLLWWEKKTAAVLFTRTQAQSKCLHTWFFHTGHYSVYTHKYVKIKMDIVHKTLLLLIEFPGLFASFFKPFVMLKN